MKKWPWQPLCTDCPNPCQVEKMCGWESGSYKNLLKYRKIDQIIKDIKNMVISVILISVEGVKI